MLDHFVAQRIAELLHFRVANPRIAKLYNDGLINSHNTIVNTQFKMGELTLQVGVTDAGSTAQNLHGIISSFTQALQRLREGHIDTQLLALLNSKATRTAEHDWHRISSVSQKLLSLHVQVLMRSKRLLRCNSLQR